MKSKQKWYEDPYVWILFIAMAASCGTGHEWGYSEAVHDYGSPSEIRAYEEEQERQREASEAAAERVYY